MPDVRRIVERQQVRGVRLEGAQAMTDPRTPDILEELATESRILRAAVALQDGRTTQAKQQMKIADLLDRAAMWICGAARRGSRDGE